MELFIAICLLMSIFLFVQDKIVRKKRSKQKSSQVKVNLNLPDIMGQAKPVRSRSVQKTATEGQIQEPEIN
ncbi:MAG TPA: conjugal transfer protein TraD, partial [Bacteroidia bacterium]|nr:conjugal transfer protein TraD [Bacteroidia bacterium]